MQLQCALYINSELSGIPLNMQVRTYDQMSLLVHIEFAETLNHVITLNVFLKLFIDFMTVFRDILYSHAVFAGDFLNSEVALSTARQLKAYRLLLRSFSFLFSIMIIIMITMNLFTVGVII